MAGRLLATVTRRAALDEAVGIVSCWQRCDPRQARRNLVGRDAEVARMAAVVDARADGRADPDYWD